jgi:hypothetical protein
MENYDPRRRHTSQDPQQRDRSRRYEGGGEEEHDPREFADDDRQSQRYRSENFGRSDYGARERPDRDRPERERSDHSSFSPDWSRDDAEPLYSDDPYYSRNRDFERHERERGEDTGGWRGDQWRRTTAEQRERGFMPREQYERERERGRRYGGEREYGSDWPYRQSHHGREDERHRDEDDSYYRGYYRRSATPFAYPGGSGQLFTESWAISGPYAGRGPKGYKRSDQQIVEEASQRLERDGDVDASDIEVTAQDGIITLSGTVPDRMTKRRAEECVENVYGVRDVMNQICVAGLQGQSSGEGSQGLQGSAQRSQAGSTRPGSGQPAKGATGASAEQSPTDDKRGKH